MFFLFLLLLVFPWVGEGWRRRVEEGVKRRKEGGRKGEEELGIKHTHRRTGIERRNWLLGKTNKKGGGKTFTK